jgi:hypothetical protein
MELLSITVITVTAVSFLVLGAKAHDRINPAIDAFIERIKKLFGGK